MFVYRIKYCLMLAYIWYGVIHKKLFHKSDEKMLNKNEDHLAEIWKLGTYETILRLILFQKKILHILIYLVDLAIWMCNFENFDIVQISSKFAQRYHFVCNFNCKNFSILGSLDNAENA